MFSTIPLLTLISLITSISAAAVPEPVDQLLARAPPVQIKTYTPSQLAKFATKPLSGSPLNSSTILAREQQDKLSPRDLVGADNRVLWTSPDYPYSAIGKIVFGGTGSTNPPCSGVLVGRRHVATSRRCVPTNSGWSARFMPSYYDGERLGGSNVIVSIQIPWVAFGVCGYKDDWAVFVLADAIGDVRGWLGSKVIDCPAQRNIANWFHMGWPTDKNSGNRPYRQEAITVTRCDECPPGGPLETDADVKTGQLGGPLWLWENGQRYVYGVASYELAVGRNYFASGPDFLGGIGAARTDYP